MSTRSTTTTLPPPPTRRATSKPSKKRAVKKTRPEPRAALEETPRRVSLRAAASHRLASSPPRTGRRLATRNGSRSRAGRRGRGRFATGSAAADTLPGEGREVLKPFESLRHTTVVRTRNAERFAVRPMNVDEAIAAAVAEAG
jgi:hypothetical protein